jgi:hypothetical protein
MRKTLLLFALLLTGASDPPPPTGKIRITPPYADAPEMAPKPASPHGTLHSFLLFSRESRIYPGIRQRDTEATRRRDAWGNRIAAPAGQQSEPGPYRREVFVYVPAGYRPVPRRRCSSSRTAATMPPGSPPRSTR